jgi:hypothetical protein
LGHAFRWRGLPSWVKRLRLVVYNTACGGRPHSRDAN